MPPVDFAEKFPHADRSALELLTRMLTFGTAERVEWYQDPSKRITVQEALQSEFVAAVRRPEYEVPLCGSDYM